MNSARVVAILTAGFALHAWAAEPKQKTAQPVQLTPDELAWRSFPSLPAGARVSVLYGDPKKKGPCVFRVKFPPNYRVPAHRTRDESRVTVISGTLYRGLGDEFDEAKLKALPPGSFVFHAAGEAVFVATKDEEVVLQVDGRGPIAPLIYVNPADDPRTQR